MTCAGCGKYPKQVSESCINYFCNHCLENGNYNRFKNKQPLIKLLKNIKKEDIVLGANGRPYSIIDFQYVLGENKYYLCQDFLGTNNYSLGDYFFVRKLKIREAKKIKKLIECGENTLHFTYEQNVKISCLDCLFRNQNNCDKFKKSLIYCDPETCKFYKII